MASHCRLGSIPERILVLPFTALGPCQSLGAPTNVFKYLQPVVAEHHLAL